MLSQPRNELRVRQNRADDCKRKIQPTHDLPPCNTITGTLTQIGAPNDEVERRGASPAPNEGTLSQSSTPSLVPQSCDPRSLEPIVRRGFGEPSTVLPRTMLRQKSLLHR